MGTTKRLKGSAKRVEQRSLTRKEHFQLGEREPKKFTPQQGWLKEIWGKWPGDEPIEDLLAALKKD